uniref:Ionotropic glutamate receptor L-glutamate and glycine-binding domain-containing protein n=1 Tax=Timema douglasi TaxID=61478 RepID=A0A7R8Z970_TIMDO|nr:unnamed protein product [Timema douglasi]
MTINAPLTCRELRSLKAHGGLAHGRDVTAPSLSRWVNSMPACIQVTRDSFCDAFPVNSDQQVEMREYRQSQDNKDRNICMKWQRQHSPFEGLPGVLVSLGNGVLGWPFIITMYVLDKTRYKLNVTTKAKQPISAKFDLSVLPPTSAEARQNSLRAFLRASPGMAWYWLCLAGVVFTSLVVPPGGALGDQTLFSKGMARVIHFIQENITTRCIFIHHRKDQALHQDAVLMDVTKLIGSPKVVISRNTSEQLHTMKDLNLCSNSRPLHLVLTTTGFKDAHNLSSLSLWNDSMWLVAADDSSKSYIESSACQWHYHLLLMAQLIEDMLHISEISCLHGKVHKSLFAVWSKRDDLEIFAEEKIGLNGLVLRAATLQRDESSLVGFIPGPKDNLAGDLCQIITAANSRRDVRGGLASSGEETQFHVLTQFSLSPSTQFVIPEDEAYGQPMSDGGWNGVVGMVMRQEVDVGVAPITMSLDRNDRDESSLVGFIPGPKDNLAGDLCQIITAANSRRDVRGGLASSGEETQFHVLTQFSLSPSTQFVIPEDEAYGQPMSDGGWNGVVGMVMRQEVDVGVAPITMSLDRNDVIDFTIPLLLSKYVPAVSSGVYLTNGISS